MLDYGKKKTNKDKEYYEIKTLDQRTSRRFDNDKTPSDLFDSIPKPVIDFKNTPMQPGKKELIDKLYDYTAALKNPNNRYKEAMKKVGRANIFEQGNVPIKYIVGIRKRMEDRKKFLIKRKKRQDRADQIENIKTEIKNFKLKSLKPKIANLFVKYILNKVLMVCNSTYDYFYFLKTIALLPQEKRQLFKGIKPHPSNTLFVLSVKKGINISNIKEIDGKLREIDKRERLELGGFGIPSFRL